MSKYVIGLDYGTDSVRSLIVDASNGEEIASEVVYYARWKDGKFCNLAKNQFRQHPHAMFILWKDHTGTKEADEINKVSRSWGGIYSSEWFWAKVLHTLREDPKIQQAAFSWVEHCDWIPALLTGNTDPLLMKRSRCAAGHKAMWHEDFKGLPSVLDAQKAMGSGYEMEYKPVKANAEAYKKLYESYCEIGEFVEQYSQKV